MQHPFGTASTDLCFLSKAWAIKAAGYMDSMSPPWHSTNLTFAGARATPAMQNAKNGYSGKSCQEAKPTQSDLCH